MRVSSDEAFAAMRRLMRTKGLLVGPSSGAAVHAAWQLASQGGGKRIVVILPDGAERYLSLL
jgi:cysteine synthase A